MPPAIDRQILAPVIRVAAIDDLLANIERIQNIRTGPKTGGECRFLEIGATRFIPLPGENGQAANGQWQIAGRDALFEGEFYPMG